MKTDVCGYDLDAVDGETRRKIIAVYGIEPSCIDIGRDDDGELRSFLIESAEHLAEPSVDAVPSAESAPRLFDPPALVAAFNGCEAKQGDLTRQEPGSLPIPRNVASSIGRTVALWQQRAREYVTGTRRKTVMFAAGGGFAVVVIALALIPPAGSPKPSALPDAATAAPMGGASAPVQPDLSDPQSASIELALNGAISGLGNMQGVARSAVRASIASRAGDIVLIDVNVTKPSGLTAFATVLLQKVGSQWRMRQIVDERN